MVFIIQSRIVLMVSIIWKQQQHGFYSLEQQHNGLHSKQKQPHEFSFY